jgi:hypothetical protein
MGGNNMGGGRRQNVPLRLQTLDSSGPIGKLRGNAYQLHEKYLGLARDAHSSGDRVAAENYFQHAEHYYRIINSTGGSTSRHDFDAFATNEGEQPEVPQNYPQPYNPNGGQGQPHNPQHNQPQGGQNHGHGHPQSQPQPQGSPHDQNHGQPQSHGQNHGHNQNPGQGHGPGPNGGPAQPSGNSPQSSGGPNDRNDRQPY